MKYRDKSWYSANQQYLNASIFHLQHKIQNNQDEASEICWEQELAPNLDLLIRRYQLSDFERDLVLLAAGCELSGAFRKHISECLGNSDAGYFTLQDALSILPDTHWDAIGPNGTLRKNNLIRLKEGEPLLNRKFTLDENILQFLTGFSTFGEQLVDICKPYDDITTITQSQKELVSYCVKYIQATTNNIIILNGLTKDKPAIANACAKDLQLRLFRINAFSLPDNIRDIKSIIKEWNNQALLNDLALYIDYEGIDNQNDIHRKVIHHLLLNCESLVIIGTTDDHNLHLNNKLEMNIGKPTPAEQKQLWSAYLNKLDSNPVLLAIVSKFNFHNFQIQSIGQEYELKSESAASYSERNELLHQICSAHARPSVQNLAYQLKVKAKWEDLILDQKKKNTLRSIVDHYTYKQEVFESYGFNKKLSRSKGLSVLFTGESGTGKTMAAEVLANELNLNLYRIDLSQVINKYIGETEKT